jgi:hypothetical protein
MSLPHNFVAESCATPKILILPVSETSPRDFCQFSERDSGYWKSWKISLFNAHSSRLVQKIVVLIWKASGVDLEGLRCGLV